MSLGITKSGAISHLSPSVRDRHIQRYLVRLAGWLLATLRGELVVFV